MFLALSGLLHHHGTTVESLYFMPFLCASLINNAYPQVRAASARHICPYDVSASWSGAGSRDRLPFHHDNARFLASSQNVPLAPSSPICPWEQGRVVISRSVRLGSMSARGRWGCGTTAEDRSG